jgi:chromosome segregation ATPase
MALDETTVNERITKLETKVEEHTKLLDKQQDRNEILIEMKTLLQMQTDVNAEQNKQMREFGTTLNNVNDNLTNLNISQQQFKTDMNEIKTDMNEIGSRVEEIEKKADEHKIDPVKVFLKILGFIGTIVGGAIAAYVYIKLGLK